MSKIKTGQTPPDEIWICHHDAAENWEPSTESDGDENWKYIRADCCESKQMEPELPELTEDEVRKISRHFWGLKDVPWNTIWSFAHDIQHTLQEKMQ